MASKAGVEPVKRFARGDNIAGDQCAVERIDGTGMSNTFVAAYRDKDGIKHDARFASLDDATAFLRAHIERIRDAVDGEVGEYEPKHRRPRTLAARLGLWLALLFRI